MVGAGGWRDVKGNKESGGRSDSGKHIHREVYFVCLLPSIVEVGMGTSISEGTAVYLDSLYEVRVGWNNALLVLYL